MDGNGGRSRAANTTVASARRKPFFQGLPPMIRRWFPADGGL